MRQVLGDRHRAPVRAPALERRAPELGRGEIRVTGADRERLAHPTAGERESARERLHGGFGVDAGRGEEALTSVAYADACTAFRAAIDAELVAFATYQAARRTEWYAAASKGLLAARETTHQARKAVGLVQDDYTTATTFAALEAASVVARTVIDWQGDAVFEAAEDDAAFASWRAHEAVFAATCR